MTAIYREYIVFVTALFPRPVLCHTYYFHPSNAYCHSAMPYLTLEEKWLIDCLNTISSIITTATLGVTAVRRSPTVPKISTISRPPNLSLTSYVWTPETQYTGCELCSCSSPQSQSSHSGLIIARRLSGAESLATPWRKGPLCPYQECPDGL